MGYPVWESWKENLSKHTLFVLILNSSLLYMFIYLVSIDCRLHFIRKFSPLRMLEDLVGFENRQIWVDSLGERHILEVHNLQPHQAIQKVLCCLVYNFFVPQCVDDALNRFEVTSYLRKNSILQVRRKDHVRSRHAVGFRRYREAGGYEKGFVRGFALVRHRHVGLIPMPQQFDI